MFNFYSRRLQLGDLVDLHDLQAHASYVDIDLEELEYVADNLMKSYEVFNGGGTLYIINPVVEAARSVAQTAIEFKKYLRANGLVKIVGRDFKKYPKTLAKLADRMEKIGLATDPPMMLTRKVRYGKPRSVWYGDVDVDFLFELERIDNLAEDMIHVCDDMADVMVGVRDTIEAERMRRDDSQREMRKRLGIGDWV